ncbi:hypothetical protein [Kitasatospora sp. NPDC008115]|uniref:hypothetical protein n=1 Tax=Kitasatospora sp. NPDC008115 TaxID=3364022 RepID=UPI0036EB7020
MHRGRRPDRRPYRLTRRPQPTPGPAPTPGAGPSACPHRRRPRCRHSTTPPAATRTLRCLKRRRADAAKLRRIRRVLGQLAADPRHPGLHTHRYHALPGHAGRRVFDSYVENGANAWRIYWTRGPDTAGRPEHVGQDDGVLTVLSIGPYR